MVVLLALIVLSTLSGLVSRSVGAPTRVVIMMVAISATLAYALYPRLM